MDAASAVIRQAQQRAATAREGTVRGSAAVKKAKLYIQYSPQALLDADAAARAREEREANEKAAAAEAKRKAAAEKDAARVVRVKHRTCRLGCGRVHRGSVAWVKCPCECFVVCSFCLKSSDGAAVSAAHHLVCSGKK